MPLRCPDDAELAEAGFINFPSRHPRRIISRNRAALDLPTLRTTMVLRNSWTARQFEKSRAVFQSLHEHRNNLGVLVFEKKFHEVTQVQVHLIAIAHQITETLACLQRAVA
jgi:hypothetical protein